MPEVALSDLSPSLQARFGFDQFREGQEPVIRHLLDGRSALAVFPTGSGKSLCYQLPAVLLSGVTLVVSPLIALMKDQIRFLEGRGIPAARLDSTIDATTWRATTASLRRGACKLLYVAPERFANERFIQLLRTLSIGMLVVDEAHCVSEWGHNFRPDYLSLARHARALGVTRILALTATATPPVVKEICATFGISPEATVLTGFHRPNLYLQAEAVEEEAKAARVIRELTAPGAGSAIIYVTLQKRAEQVAAILAEAGFAVRAYHAGLPAEERAATQDWFMETPGAMVVATIAFGMGIDKADIRQVIHWNLPKSLEGYAQEIGRAGRDGAPARCLLLADPIDRVVLENFVHGDTPEPSALRGVLEELQNQPDTFALAMSDWSNRHDIRPLVLETLLTYLTLDGALETTAPFHATYRFQPLKASAEILSGFDPRRAKFIRGLFQCAKKGRTWFEVDLEQAMEKLDAPRERVVAAFNYLEEQGHLTVRAAGVRQGYRFLQRPVRVEEWLERLWPRFERRETMELERIGRVLAFIQEKSCLTNRLLEHFGDSLPNGCGHCARCDGERAPRLTLETSPPTLPPQLATLHREHPALEQPRRLAKFLCGIPSPALSRAKLSRHPQFGSLSRVPFRSVLAAGELAAGEMRGPE